MKKVLSLFLAVLAALVLCSCGSTSPPQMDEQTPSQTQVETEPDTVDESETSLTDLKQGDEVSIVGQKANSTLVDENTIWLQVQQDDGTFVIYHCQMKDEYISAAGELKMLDIVKLKGCFFSYADLQQENTSPTVTLYDCELIED